LVRIVQSERSVSELKEIIAERNERAADNMLRRIKDRIHGLRDFPEQGKSRDDIGPGVRQVVSRPYVILYEHHAEQGVLEILAVLHGRRDLRSAL
jgi:toxin ParE1/3/4